MKVLEDFAQHTSTFVAWWDLVGAELRAEQSMQTGVRSAETERFSTNWHYLRRQFVIYTDIVRASQTLDNPMLISVT